MKFHFYSTVLLSCFCFTSYVQAEEISLEVKGISGELKDNVKVLVSAIDTESFGAQRIQKQMTEAIKKGLRAKGYYEPTITYSQDKSALGNPIIIAHINAGEPIRIEENNIHLSGDALQDNDYLTLLKTVPTKGTVLDHGKYEKFKSSLTAIALRKGYFDAGISKSQLAVAPSLYQGFWNIDFDSGKRYRFGHVTFENSQIKEEYLRNMLPFKEGEYYTSEKLSDFTKKLSGTNWFNSVVAVPQLDKVYGDQELPIETVLTPRNKNIMELGLGYSTDVGVRGKLGWKKPWINSRGQSIEMNATLSQPEQILDFSYKIPLKKNPLEHYYVVQAGFKREDHLDTRANSTSLNVARYWDLSSGWQRAINLRWSLDDFTQGDVSHSTMLLYPGVQINRTRQRGGLMPRWGDSQRYSIDVSDTSWGSDVRFSVFQAQNTWIRTYFDNHRFIARGAFGWIETGSFDKVPPSLRFFAGGDRSIRGYKYKSISPKDSKGKLTGASRLVTGSVEYQYNVTGKWWGAAFFDAGEAVHDFSGSELKKGAGVGVRWESPFGPIKLDVAKPIGDDDENGVQFYIGLGPEL